MTLVWRPGWNGLTEPEAVEYVAAVEAADGQDLEFGVARAINDFVLGCKNDGIWSAIKASCILAGARTLNGALVPLVGAAPTNFNFVAGDYNRETGLVGDGSTKYLNSNRNNNADPQNSQHLSVFVSTYGTGGMLSLDGTSNTGASLLAAGISRNRNGANPPGMVANAAGFCGNSRASSANFTQRVSGVSTILTQASQAPSSAPLLLLRQNVSTYGDHRIAFYSIGEALDLEKLDNRVTDLMTAIGAAIP